MTEHCTAVKMTLNNISILPWSEDYSRLRDKTDYKIMCMERSLFNEKSVYVSYKCLENICNFT